jgi:ERCC4-type nuclease
MVFTDSRVGSADLAPLLATIGVPVELTTLEFGDVCFSGNGPDGATLTIGIELKRISDLLQSFATGRLTNHQLPGMTAAYDMNWLIVEGRFKAAPDGVLLWAKEREWRDGASICNWETAGYGLRRWSYREFAGRLTTLELRAGINIITTATPDDTARAIANLYEWFTGSAWEEHRSHLATPQKQQFAMLRPPTLRERVAAQLPHIGPARASMCAGAWPSVRALINAPEEEWRKLPGIGAKTAKAIVNAIAE